MSKVVKYNSKTAIAKKYFVRVAQNNISIEENIIGINALLKECLDIELVIELVDIKKFLKKNKIKIKSYNDGREYFLLDDLLRVIIFLGCDLRIKTNPRSLK